MKKFIKTHKKVSYIIFAIIVIIALLSMFKFDSKLSYEPYNKHDVSQHLILVKNGETTSDLADNLYKNNIIRDKNSFQTSFEDENSSQSQSGLIAGNYAVSPSQNTKELAKVFKEPNSQESKKLFFESISNDVVSVAKKYQIKPSLIMGHAALESNYGTSELAYKYHNYFGIKTDVKKNGVSLATDEIEDGKRVNKKQLFLKMDNMQESFEVYCKTLKNGNSYNKDQFIDVVNAATSEDAAKALVKDGYATDPELGTKIITIIHKFNLQRYDKYIITKD